MRRLLLLFILINLTGLLFAQSVFFYAPDGTKQAFKERKDLIAIKTKSIMEKQQVIQQYKLKEIYNVNEIEMIAEIDSLAIGIISLREDANVQNITYVLEYEDGTLQVPSKYIFAKCKSKNTLDDVIKEAKLEAFVQSYDLYNTSDDIYVIQFKYGIDMMEMSRLLFETKLCEFAEPCFLRLTRFFNPNYSGQWGLNNTGQYGGTSGIDIKAEKAWTLSAGNNINVAVIDEGVDLGHPDLNIMQGFDTVGNPPNMLGGAPNGNDAHGTACAGIIGSRNNLIGGIGVAPSCGIIPIRIAYNNNNGIWITYDSWIASGIRYAWESAHADVLSCSWGGGSSSSIINSEINNALSLGRNGLGCVVVFASGNDNTPTVNYPASLSNVIAVGAISPCGQRKSPSSCDGENWGSNYGSALDVVAPGVLISTTDIRGNAGYNPNLSIHTISGGNRITFDYSNRDYTVWFNGTSAAAPHVAGIAALILSIRPDLTATQVRQAIESTCTKLPAYSYSNNSSHPNGTWNNEVGHGLVNAFQAVASVAPSITGPDYLCSSAVYSIASLPAGIPVQWSISGGKATLSYPTNQSSVTANKTGNGFVEIKAVIDGGVGITRTVWAGIPVLGTLYCDGSPSSPPTTQCITNYASMNNTWYFQALPNSFNPIYTWNAQTSNFTLTQHNPNNSVTFYPRATGPMVASVTASNTCGSCNSTYYFEAVNCSGGGGIILYQIYPNPADDTITVEREEDGIENRSASPYTIQLWSETSGLVRTVDNAIRVQQVSLQGLASGTYYVHIIVDGQTVSKQTLVKK